MAFLESKFCHTKQRQLLQTTAISDLLALWIRQVDSLTEFPFPRYTADQQSSYDLRTEVQLKRYTRLMAPVLFEAVIVPHRSLSPRGLRVLSAVICGLCALTTLRFMLVRAWPVIGFSVIEVSLAIGFLWFNMRRARQSEIILLTETGLEILRTDVSGRRQAERLANGWLNVVLEERPGWIPRLLLVERQQEREIAGWLGEAEKRDLAAALKGALYRLRNPEFDNPQLRK